MKLIFNLDYLINIKNKTIMFKIKNINLTRRSKMTIMQDKKMNDDNKTAIMKAIKNIVKRERLKQREIAELLKIKQPRVSDLLALKHDKFSMDILLGYFAQFGHKVDFQFVDSERGKPVKINVLKTKTNFRSYYS